VFLLFRRLQAGNKVLSAIGAGVFLLHPLQTESVAYITGRSELLTGFLLLTATLVFLRTENSSWKWAILRTELTGAAILSKEQALAMIPLFFLFESGWIGNAPNLKAKFLENVRKHWRLWGLLTVAGCLGSVFVLRVLSQSESAG